MSTAGCMEHHWLVKKAGRQVDQSIGTWPRWNFHLISDNLLCRLVSKAVLQTSLQWGILAKRDLKFLIDLVHCTFLCPIWASEQAKDTEWAAFCSSRFSFDLITGNSVMYILLNADECMDQQGGIATRSLRCCSRRDLTSWHGKEAFESSVLQVWLFVAVPVLFHLLYYACQTVVGTCRITCAWRKLPNFGSRKVSWRLFTSSHFAFLESLVTLKLQWSQSCQAVFRNTGERFGSPADSGEPALVCSLALHSCPPKVAVFGLIGLIFLSEGLRTLCRASGWDRAQARNCECSSLAGATFCFPAALRQFTDLKDTESAAALFEACNLAANVLRFFSSVANGQYLSFF